MPKCSFCGKDIPRGTGKMFVKKEGTVFFFCSRKCEKNLLKLNRAPQSKKWTAFYRKETKEKEKKVKQQ